MLDVWHRHDSELGVSLGRALCGGDPRTALSKLNQWTAGAYNGSLHGWAVRRELKNQPEGISAKVLVNKLGVVGYAEVLLSDSEFLRDAALLKISGAREEVVAIPEIYSALRAIFAPNQGLHDRTFSPSTFATAMMRWYGIDNLVLSGWDKKHVNLIITHTTDLSPYHEVVPTSLVRNNPVEDNCRALLTNYPTGENIELLFDLYKRYSDNEFRQIWLADILEHSPLISQYPEVAVHIGQSPPIPALPTRAGVYERHQSSSALLGRLLVDPFSKNELGASVTGELLRMINLGDRLSEGEVLPLAAKVIEIAQHSTSNPWILTDATTLLEAVLAHMSQFSDLRTQVAATYPELLLGVLGPVRYSSKAVVSALLATEVLTMDGIGRGVISSSLSSRDIKNVLNRISENFFVTVATKTSWQGSIERREGGMDCDRR